MIDADFLSVVSHELRNPIAIIRGLARTLSNRDQLSEAEFDECLSRLVRQAERLGHLVEDLLDSTESGNTRLAVSLGRVDLRDVIDRMLESVPRPADKRLEVDVPSGMLVLADPFRLEQVFSNLLTNAYNHGGEVIRFQAVRQEEEVLVTLSDNGHGVPEELVPTMFDRFSRGLNATIAGLGLGLAIAREVVDASGGRIWYEPIDPTGARFHTLLQWAGGRPEDEAAISRPDRRGDSMAKILIVDDEPDIRFLHQLIFRRDGHEVRVANHGAAALERVKDERPDLVITDIMMPVMDGNGLIKSLRSDPETATIPILAVSANPSAVEGADAVLQKGSGERSNTRDRERPDRESAQMIEPLSTGVSELDLVLGGGLEPGSLVVVAGSPGTGKTLLAQQICFSNATAERKAIYYTTLSESHSKLVRHLEPFDFFDAGALGRRVDYLHLGDLLNDVSEDALGPVVTEIIQKCLEDDPVVVVIDSSKALRDFVGEHSLRSSFYELAARIAHTNAVLLFLGEYTKEDMEGSPEFSLADGIIQLAYEPLEPVDRRWLRVVKMRGSQHLSGKHSFNITRGGVEVFPRLETMSPEFRAPIAEERIGSGIPRLDEMMGGGIWRSDATAVLGPSGCGKTVLALRFLTQGLDDGERSLYVSFQESEEQLAKKAASFGWDLKPPLGSGQLSIHHVPPGQLDLDALGLIVRHELAAGSVDRVVIDSLAELVTSARETDRFAAYARALVGFIRAAGAPVMITSETRTLGPSEEMVTGLSFLFNNVILLRYIEIESEVRRALGILKMRDSDHEKGLVQFEINGSGMQIMGKLDDVTGVLGWSVLRTDH
ncbi:MAG: ATPase domain-containing protein [Actinomycetota bacterium]